MWPFKRKRIHESVAISAIFAASISLHVFWMCNFLASRIPGVDASLSLAPEIGRITGLYAVSLSAYLLSWLLLLIFFKSKDVSHLRRHAFWFFAVTVGIYLAMSFPPIYSFALTGF